MDQHPTKQFESLPTFSGFQEGCGGLSGQDLTGEEFELDETRDNQENLSTNVYLKKKIEQGFKRVVSQNNQQQSVPRGNHEYEGYATDIKRKNDVGGKSMQTNTRSKYD